MIFVFTAKSAKYKYLLNMCVLQYAGSSVPLQFISKNMSRDEAQMLYML